ncbi:hypothetical protein C0J52_28306, partial [Blattella germanica]
KHQVVCYYVTDVKVDDPVHQVETDETDRENDAGVFIDVAGCNSVELVDVFFGVDEMLGSWSCDFFVCTSVDGVFQRAALRVGLGIVNFEPYLLEQRAWPKPRPLTRYTTLILERLELNGQIFKENV